MASIFKPAPPPQQQPIEPEAVTMEEPSLSRDIQEVDRLKRRRAQPSLLSLLSDSRQSPTLL
jgi:hypothetical protein